MIRMAKPAPTKMSAMANFAGLDGSFPVSPSRSHSHANTGASIQRNSEFSDWNQLLGNGKPRSTLFVLRSANRLSVDPACSKTDQKIAEARNNAAIAYRRWRSSRLQSPELKSQPKNPSVRNNRKYPAASATWVAVIGRTPRNVPTAKTAIAATMIDPMSTARCRSVAAAAADSAGAGWRPALPRYQIG